MSAEPTMQELSDKLDRISQITFMAAKSVLDLNEAALFTGFSVGHIYRLTSKKQIPHFKKSELEDWMLENKITSNADISSQAATYVATHK